METPRDNYTTALDAAEKGIVCIPCLPGTKIPAVKWKRWQDEMPPESLLKRWFHETRMNIAIITTGMVLFDCETREKAAIVLQECGDTPYQVKTAGNGIHMGFRKRKGSNVTNKVKIKGLDIDIRTDGGLALIPNSATEKGRYEWLGQGLVPILELPVANVGWTRARLRRTLKPIGPESSPDVMVRRAQAWLACVEGAISGQGGHNKTFRVACKLTHPYPKGFGLSLEQAWPLMKEWNEQCEPEWSDAEILHKLEDSIKKRT